LENTKLVEMKDKENHIGFTAFAVKASSKALEANPVMNSTIEAEEITTYSDVNVAVAINTDPGAPIFKVADLALEADVSQLLPVLTQCCQQERGKS